MKMAKYMLRNHLGRFKGNAIVIRQVKEMGLFKAIDVGMRCIVIRNILQGQDLLCHISVH